MIDKLIFSAYGILLLAGGFFGWKAGSKISLIMGSISGILVFIGVALLASNTRGAYLLLIGVSGLLTISFLMRYLKTHAFMPSGMLLTLSLAIAIYTIVRLTQKP